METYPYSHSTAPRRRYQRHRPENTALYPIVERLAKHIHDAHAREGALPFAPAVTAEGVMAQARSLAGGDHRPASDDP